MLRRVVPTDLEIFFKHQRDPDAAAMAAFPSRDREAFTSHWHANVLGNPANEVRTILVEGHVAGYVSSWEQEGRRLVAYWVGKEHWGRGVASSALGEFLSDHERRRPIHAWVAKTNARSIRVLEKCGFHRVHESTAEPDGLVEELFRLGGQRHELHTGGNMKITIETLVRSTLDKVWSAWTTPADINQWNAANDDWHNPRSENDLRVGGRFCYRMEAKDGKMGFDFEGTYTKVLPRKTIEYVLGDNRSVAVTFEPAGGAVKVVETFEAEDANSAEMQRQGWQSILNRFSAYVEAKK